MLPPCKSLYIELKNHDITIEIIEKRLSSLTNNNKIENKSTNGKSSYFVKAPALAKNTFFTEHPRATTSKN